MEPRTQRGTLYAIGMLFGRSLIPLTAVVIVGGTVVWGPWVSLALAAVWFFVVVPRFA